GRRRQPKVDPGVESAAAAGGTRTDDREAVTELPVECRGFFLDVVWVGVSTPQHRADMFLDPGSDPREGGPRLGNERSTLSEFLRGQRLTLQLKCDGLDAGQLARRAVEPSTMSLLGLVRHMAEVERSWFRRRFARLEVPRRYQTEADPDADFNGAVADPAVV